MHKPRKNQVLEGLLCAVVGSGALISAPAYSAPADVIKHDDFEGGMEHTQKTWRRRPSGVFPDIHFPYSGRIDVAPGDEQNGNKSFRFEWREADSDGKNPSRHAELITQSFPYEATSTKLDQWLGFRVYIDPKFLGPDDQPVVLMQYHDTPGRDADGKPTESGRNPMAALSYHKGEFQYGWKGDTNEVTTKNDKGAWIYTQKGSFPLGAAKEGWNTFVFRHKFDWEGQGAVEIWCNDKYFTRQNIQLGYNDKVGPYMKFGFYWYTGRSVPNPPAPTPERVVWFDDMKVGSANATYADMRPPGSAPVTPGP